MKKTCIALLFLLLISVCSLVASPIYKSFTVNGETVSRWVIESSVFEFDEQGNIIHYKTFYDYEAWYEYDAQGNEIHYKTSYGAEEWYEYDANGNMIHEKSSGGKEYWYEYEYYKDKQIKKMTQYTRF